MTFNPPPVSPSIYCTLYTVVAVIFIIILKQYEYSANNFFSKLPHKRRFPTQ